MNADSGEEIALEPSLLVLSTGVGPSAPNVEAARALGLHLDRDGFVVPADEATAPTETSCAGVYVAGPPCGPVDANDGAIQARAAAGKACLFLKRGIR